MARVLVCGVYLADRENLAGSEMAELGASRHHRVTQRWIALDINGGGICDLPHTGATIKVQTPKFTLVNGLIEDVQDFDRLIVCDDDVQFPARFLDDFLALVDEFSFAIAQPARTPDSYIDHFITTQMPGLRGRQTRFVEIGPVTCIDRSAYPVLLPFDRRSPMGWGLDFVWPVLAERAGLRMGIVDATPIGHCLRMAKANYRDLPVEQQMKVLLDESPSLMPLEAYTIVEAYA